MKETNPIFRLSDLLNWLGKSILFVGLITFSGYVPESSAYNAEPTRTELNEVRSTGSKKTFNLEKVFSESLDSLLPTISGINFTYYLHYQRNIIALKLEGNYKERPTSERDGFLLYYSTSKSEEFHINQERG